MKNVDKEFLKTADKYLIRHRSILDVVSKYQETAARVNRAIAKTVTNCGCLKIDAKKQKIPSSIKLEEMKNYVSSHIEGNLCKNCREIIQTELGSNLFYVAALCSLLGLDFEEVIKKELDRISTLGVYSLT